MNLKLTKTCSASLMLLLMASCADGIDDNERFSSGVTNTQLQSPELTSDCFATIMNSDGSESVKVTWPVVFGAGGYLCNVAIVDDPANPNFVVTDSVIDGCTVTFEKLEDTKYEVSVKSLGNDKLNNREAESASVYAYSTLVPAMTVPEGAEISQWITEQLATATSEDGEIGFELEAGKTYNLDGALDFGLNKVTFRGDKANRPTVVVGAEGRITTQAGLKLKFMNFDCTNSEQYGLFVLSDTPDESISTEALGFKADGGNQNGYVIMDPIVIQECNVKGLKNSLLYGNKNPWSLWDFRINDCIVQLNNEGSNGVINLYGGGNGLIKEMRIENSTFYNLVANSTAYFIRYSNTSNANPKKIFGNGNNSTTHVVTHCTFSKTFSNKDFGNMMPNTNTVSTTVDHCIFYDVYRLYQYFQSNAYRSTSFNTICGISASVNSNDNGGRKDSNGNPYATEEDPQFVGPTLQEFDLTQAKGGVNFQPTAPYAVENKIGDPRWYE